MWGTYKHYTHNWQHKAPHTYTNSKYHHFLSILSSHQSQNIANSKSLISLTRKPKQPTQVHTHGLLHTFTFDKRTYSFTQHTSVKRPLSCSYTQTHTQRLSIRIIILSFLLIFIFVILQLLHVPPVAFPAPPAVRVLFTPATWTE